MSVQTQIDRIAAAKTAIKTAIEGKGVTVPDATTLDGFASLVEAIEAGGGGNRIFGRYFEAGSITPAEDITQNYTITFEKSFSGTYSAIYGGAYNFILMCENTSNPNLTAPNSSWLWLIMGRKGTNSDYAYGQYTSSSGSVSNASYSGVVGSNSYGNKATIVCTSSKKLVAGRTYNWIAICNEPGVGT